MRHMQLRSTLVMALIPVAALSCSSDDSTPASTDSGPAETGATGGGSAHDGAAGTGGGGGSSPTDGNLPNIDPSIDLAKLTQAESAELCDWRNAELGGYG